MYKNGGYTGDDRMCDLVCDRYAVLQVMSRFGIALGFGDKTIAEVCAENKVDAATFLAVVNMLMNFGNGAELAGEVSVRSLTDYLHNSHSYFLDFRLPAIRRKLIEAVDCAQSDVSFAIMRFFDEYAAEVQRHMSYEEQTVFPYVESLLAGEKSTVYSIDIFRRRGRNFHPGRRAAGGDGTPRGETRTAERPREGDHRLRGEGHDQQADRRCPLHLGPHCHHPSPQHRRQAADTLRSGAYDLCHRQ